MAVQEGPTSIRVSWSPPSPLGDTTGYRIYYNSDSDSDSGSKKVSGGSTNNSVLTGLQNGVSYTISIVGTSQHFPSDEVEVTVDIGDSEYFQLSHIANFRLPDFSCLLHTRIHQDLFFCANNYDYALLLQLVHINSCSSWPAKCECGLNNSHQHLPLLECPPWLSGGQL